MESGMGKKKNMKYSGIGGQAVLEGIMMKIRISMPWQSENRMERLK